MYNNIVFSVGSAIADLSCSSVAITNDAIAEAEEFFTISLSSTNLSVALVLSTRSSLTTVIQDDDGEMQK